MYILNSQFLLKLKNKSWSTRDELLDPLILWVVKDSRCKEHQQKGLFFRETRVLR